jgi:hypothetical protein
MPAPGFYTYAPSSDRQLGVNGGSAANRPMPKSGSLCAFNDPLQMDVMTAHLAGRAS